jgi:hypothetical protein
MDSIVICQEPVYFGSSKRRGDGACGSLVLNVIESSSSSKSESASNEFVFMVTVLAVPKEVAVRRIHSIISKHVETTGNLLGDHTRTPLTHASNSIENLRSFEVLFVSVRSIRIQIILNLLQRGRGGSTCIRAGTY